MRAQTFVIGLVAMTVACDDGAAADSTADAASESSGDSGSDGDGTADSGSGGQTGGGEALLHEGQPGSFFENLAIAPDGGVVFSDLTGRAVLRFDEDSGVRTLAAIDDSPAGLAFDVDGTLYVTAFRESILELDDPFVASCRVWRIDADGDATVVADAPQAGMLNGIERVAPGVFLVADSSAGTIWRLDADSGALAPWLQDDRLEPVAGLVAPGANGLHLRDGVLWIANSGRAQLLRIAIDDAAAPAGPLEIAMTGVVVDDFAFAASGEIYAATHLSDVIRIDPDGAWSALAVPQDLLAGPTSLVFGHGEHDRASIYVVSDGGLFFHRDEPTAAAAARLVRIALDEVGP